MKWVLSIFSVLFEAVAQAYREWQARKQGEAEGREDAAQEAQAKTIDNQQKAKEVKDEVQSLGGSDLKRRAGRWVRPDDPGPGSDPRE